MSILIDSDNAMGSRLGDVDDAFAIAALLQSRVEVIALSAVAGNTSERRAFANNMTIGRRLRFTGPVLHGSEVASFLETHAGTTVLALGPLTNVAAALRAGASIGHVLVVGGTLSTRGNWPPWWPHEFNLTKDRRAAREVFDSGMPLTIFPLDVARKLVITRAKLAAMKGDVATFLERGARRWFTRLRLLKGSGEFPVYDLAAALYLVSPGNFTIERTAAAMRANTFIRFGAGTRPVDVCRALRADHLWADFARRIEDSP